MTHRSSQIASRLLPFCLLMSCQEEPTTPTAPQASLSGAAAAVTDNTVASVKVIPDSQLVFVGDQFQIVAQAKNKSGQVLDRIPVWSVANTSVFTAVTPAGATMTFKALKAGTTTAKATVDGKSRFSKAVVRAVAGAKVVITPETAIVEAGATVQFVAKGLTKTGETAGVNVVWTAETGAISSSGVLTAGGIPGTFRVIARSGFGAADTTLVTIGAAPDPVAAVTLVPASISLAAGDTVRFDAYGRTAGGDSVDVTVTYTATGGTIAGRLYTAGSVPGSYNVIAMSAAGIGDTSDVSISTAPIARVTLQPDIAASRPGEPTQFVASVMNSVGESVLDPVTYETTCGTMGGAGVFTAPQAGSGSCLVIASAGDKADTTEVILLADTPGQGVPFGVYDFWTTSTKPKTSGVAAYTASHDYIPPNETVGHIAAARSRGVRVMLAMTGGDHSLYKTNGVFDMAKWKAAMDKYNTAAIRDAIAAGVADGTILGNSVMDEPQQHGISSDPNKTWGPSGTMTKVRVDSMCGYVESIFSTLPVGVGHDYLEFESAKSYFVCQFVMSQYAVRKGNFIAWRDGGLAQAARDGIAMLFSMNLLDGGTQDKSGPWDCAGTGGIGTRSPNCRVTPSQLRDWGKAFGQGGCAVLSWRYDTAFMAKPENQAAISDVAITLAGVPRTPCTGTRPAE
ncbi:MAG: hypothetical protein ABI766_13005 [Gemmatimonadales bacterium]